MAVIGRAEISPFFQRSPILIAVGGGLAFAAMAWISDFVLFSGQQDMQRLVTLGNPELLYIAVAKWAALVIALFAGWRGGPIFPMFTAVAALAVVVDALFDIGPNLVMVAGIGAVGVVLARGSIAMAFILTLYAVPLTYSGVILVGCAGAAVGLGIGKSLGLLPATEEHSPDWPPPGLAPVGINAPAARELDR
jgi:H+/Cl- antiporter ClcA